MREEGKRAETSGATVNKLGGGRGGVAGRGGRDGVAFAYVELNKRRGAEEGKGERRREREGGVDHETMRKATFSRCSVRLRASWKSSSVTTSSDGAVTSPLLRPEGAYESAHWPSLASPPSLMLQLEANLFSIVRRSSSSLIVRGTRRTKFESAWRTLKVIVGRSWGRTLAPEAKDDMDEERGEPKSMEGREEAEEVARERVSVEEPRRWGRRGLWAMPSCE